MTLPEWSKHRCGSEHDRPETGGYLKGHDVYLIK
jgi:hypothetical protein